MRDDNYGTINKKRARKFITQNKPSSRNAKSHCRSYCSYSILFGRFIIRNSIPLIFGFAAGMGVKWSTEIIDVPELKNGFLLETSNVVSCSVTLLLAYSTDWLLNKCWPADPYKTKQPDFPLLGSINDDIQQEEYQMQIRL